MGGMHTFFLPVSAIFFPPRTKLFFPLLHLLLLCSRLLHTHTTIMLSGMAADNPDID